MSRGGAGALHKKRLISAIRFGLDDLLGKKSVSLSFQTESRCRYVALTRSSRVMNQESAPGILAKMTTEVFNQAYPLAQRLTAVNRFGAVRLFLANMPAMKQADAC